MSEKFEINRSPDTSPELEPTKELQPQTPKFNWVAFVVMVISLIVAWLIGIIIPGPVDDFAYQLVIASIYGFMYAHGFNVKNIFKK